MNTNKNSTLTLESFLMNLDKKSSNDSIIQSLRSATPVYWKNPHCTTFDEAINDVGLGYDDVIDASNRLNRFAPFIELIFPETKATKGIIESPFYRTEKLQKALNITQGKLYVKADNQLPISGSIKARGGIYEVLQFAEGLALKHGLLKLDDDYCKLASPPLKEFFSDYSIAVGSTGNLGLSIGIMSAKLGFNASVHMSSDAKQWKKDKLRAHGVQVVEYDGDYGEAVTNGRKQAENDAYTYFVDDENSKDLFLGYAVAGLRLKEQFDEKNIVISNEQPLIVYLPCGVGGGPGGVAFGLKLAFKDNVHCVFAEPVQSPCMMLGIYTGLHDEISVNDIGLSNHTVADGLAVGRASGFIGKAMQRSLDAFYTKTDTEMFQLLKLAYDTEQLKLEPSASIGFAGVPYYANTHGNDDVKHDNIDNLDNAIHLVWATGGNMMPDDEFQACLSKG